MPASENDDGSTSTVVRLPVSAACVTHCAPVQGPPPTRGPAGTEVHVPLTVTRWPNASKV